MDNNIFGYKNLICVVTGASSGIGKSITEKLVQMGAKVYALDLNVCHVDGIEKFIQCNLADSKAIDRVFESIPDHIDSFFGIAGLSGSKTDYITTFNCNYTANFYITEKYLKKRMSKSGTILYVSSTAGLNWEKYIKEEKKVVNSKTWEEVNKSILKIAKKSPSTFAYIYSKRCISYYASKMAIELADKGIRVNNVMPGSTSTGMKDEFEKMAGGKDALIASAGKAGRLATPEEMAYPCIFLNSKLSSFTSGLDYVCDYADLSMKKLKIKKDIENIPATNPIILTIAKKMMNKQK